MNPNLVIDRSNIIMLDKYFDSNYIMPFVDAMISDYSSIAFDFMRLKRPLILFPFDKERYNDGSRVFQIDYDDLVEGVPQVKTYEELKEQLKMIGKQTGFCNEKLWKPTRNLMESILEI